MTVIHPNIGLLTQVMEITSDDSNTSKHGTLNTSHGDY